MKRSEKIHFLSWLRNAENCQLELRISELEAIELYLVEPKIINDARWMQNRILEEIDNRNCWLGVGALDAFYNPHH